MRASGDKSEEMMVQKQNVRKRACVRAMRVRNVRDVTVTTDHVRGRKWGAGGRKARPSVRRAKKARVRTRVRRVGNYAEQRDVVAGETEAGRRARRRQGEGKVGGGEWQVARWKLGLTRHVRVG